MNNKGFTLIEILVVIAILSVIGVLVTVNLMDSVDSTKQKNCDAFVKEVEDAACVYAGLSDKSVVCNREHCEPLTLDFLISEGLIQSEIDSCTNKEIDGTKTVSVSWDEFGEKHCKYNGVREYER